MSGEGSMNEPTIAERVKFWQEQDRINRELIPRVVKNHELLAKHVESHEDGDSLARAQIERLEGRVSEIDSLTRAQTERLEGRVTEIERSSSEALSRWLPHIALALALLAIALALVR